MEHKKKILTKILIPFISILFISLTVLIFYQSIQNKKHIKQFAEQTETLLAEQIEKSAEILFATTEKSLLSISREDSATNILVSQKYKNKIIEDFKRYEEINGSIKALMMGTNDDKFYRYPINTKSQSNYRPTQQIWYKQAMNHKGRVVYTSPFKDELSGETVIVIAKTVNKDAQVIGVVGAVLTVDLFQGLIQNVKIGDSGYAFAVDKLGTITAHQDANQIGKSVIQEEFFSKMQGDHVRYCDYSLEGEERFMTFVTNARTGWNFAVTMNYGEINDQISRVLGKNLLIFVIVLALAIFVSIGVARSIVHPIRRLATAIQQVEQGELDIQLDIGNEDEIGQLIHNFNYMVEQVRDLVKEILIACERLVHSSSECYEVCEGNTVASDQVAASVVNIVEGSNIQMRQVENIFERTQLFARQIRDIADNTQKVYNVMLQNQEINEKGVHIIEDLHSTSQMNIEYVEQGEAEIKGLYEKTRTVVKITKSIEKIAKQTNLISVNASIEAARARQYGQGFGVIAEEIHKLADSTEDLAGEIYQYLDEMIKEADKTVEIMNDIKQTSEKQFASMLKTQEIFNQIKEFGKVIDEEIEDLNCSIINLNHEKDSIVNGIESISNISQQASTWSQQIEDSVKKQVENNQKIFQASEGLVDISKVLEEKIKAFRI